MHEISLVTALIDQIQDLSKKESFSKVEKISLEIGEFSGVEPSNIEFCFHEITCGTILENAQLSIMRIPILVRCNLCKTETAPRNGDIVTCTECHSQDIQFLRGQEFRVLDLNVT